MMKFKEFYEARYGKYPGAEGERYEDIFKRLTDAFAEYVDYVASRTDGA